MVKLGTESISDLRLGTSQVQAVYLGDELVWSNYVPPGEFWGLCFTAEEPNAVIAMSSEGTPPSLDLLYSTNASTWSTFTPGTTTVTLANVGDKVWLKAGSGGNSGTGSSSLNYWKFSFTNHVAASGNIMSLLNGDEETYEISQLGCFAHLFNGCTSLTQAPDLPATTLANSCYFSMFYGCTSLTQAPDLPATTLQNACYQSMFEGCTSLMIVPEFTTQSAPDQCCNRMFYGCTSLSSAPIHLNATRANFISYQDMFNGCSSLTSAPEIAISGPDSAGQECCNRMFYGCTSLSSAPYLYSINLQSSRSYSEMFYGCSHINSMSVSLTSWGNVQNNNTYNWVSGVAENGTFYCPFVLSDIYDVSHIPVGWTRKLIPHWGLCFTAEEPNAIIGMTKTGTINVHLEYSTDTNTWNTFTPGTTTVTLANVGDKVWLKAWSLGNGGTADSTSNYLSFSITNRVAASGNIMSLLNGKNAIDVISQNYAFYKLFNNCSSLTQAPELPATTLADYCYSSMFNNCSSLTSAPELPATTLVSYCYQYMFQNCTSLTQAPELPATVLSSNCYQGMFSGCTSLTSAPALPATTLASNCYSSMFNSCTSLTSAPALPATTLASNCYGTMFRNCISLTSAPALPATTLASNCYSSMFSGCSSLIAAPELQATVLSSNCYSSMFQNCYSLTSAPELQATVLSSNCYSSMFQNCYSLTSAPALPATTLASNCYYNMFSGCSSLIAAPALPATTLASTCYSGMFNNCSSLTQAPVLPATTLVERCYYNMFRNCISLSSISADFTEWNPSNATTSWVTNVSSSGTFYCPTALGTNDTITRGASNCPTGWTVVNKTYFRYSDGTTYMHDINDTLTRQAVLDSIAQDNQTSAALRYVYMGSDINAVGPSAFSDWSYLRGIVIGENVEIVDDNAFRRDASISSITFAGNSLTAIGPYGFAGVQNTGRYDLPEGLQTIGNNAFVYGGSAPNGLSVVSIPSTVTSIGGSAFSNSNALLSVIFNGKTMNEVTAMSNYPWGASGKIFVN